MGGKGKLTVRQAAERANVSPGLIYQWCRERRLPHLRLGAAGRRGKILVDENDLERFMRDCQVDGHPLLGGG